MKPLAIDLFAGLGGWTDGLLAEGWAVIGFDIERHEYWMPEYEAISITGGKGTKPVAKRGWTAGCAVALGVEGETQLPRTRLVRYPAQLVLQDVLTIHGKQFKDVDLIVASPPCQEYSYMAMPWSRAKAIQAEYLDGTRDVKKLTALFDACFRIQREACEAAGRHIPMVVENVRGAEPWVGRAAAKYGSFYLWGDVPALIPITLRAFKDPARRGKSSHQKADMSGWGNPGVKVPATDGGRRTDPGKGARFTSRDCGVEGTKMKDADGYERSHPQAFGWKSPRTSSGNTSARKAASAMIAKIPEPLSRWIGRVYYPEHSKNKRTSDNARRL